MQVDKSLNYPSMRNPRKIQASKRYIFSSNVGMQYAGSGFKLPCRRTFKLKTAKTSAARGECGNAAFGDNNPTCILKATLNPAKRK